MEAYRNYKRITNWMTSNSEEYELERRQLETNGMIDMQSILHNRYVATKETIVNKLVRDLGWDTAVDHETIVTRIEFEENISQLDWSDQFVEYVGDMFGKTPKKRIEWNVKNVLTFVNAYLEIMYLTKIEPTGYTHNVARSYWIVSTYKVP